MNGMNKKLLKFIYLKVRKIFSKVLTQPCWVCISYYYVTMHAPVFNTEGKPYFLQDARKSVLKLNPSLHTDREICKKVHPKKLRIRLRRCLTSEFVSMRSPGWPNRFSNHFAINPTAYDTSGLFWQLWQDSLCHQPVSHFWMLAWETLVSIRKKTG